ncbi:MAG TPA: transposase [Acidimicrobiales bacterium]|nr:transposase [Acidimicrobiales bacterium]
MTIVETRPRIVGSVDTHLDGHVAAALDPLGRLLGTESFPATRAGETALFSWLGSFGLPEVVGVEGTGAYGAGLLRSLVAAGVEETAPGLVALVGVGTVTGAMLLAAAGDNPERLRSEAAFAHLCGVAPLEASSGRSARHRLDRGGDRQANSALWRIVVVRSTCHPRARAYLERRVKEGRSKREVVRSLKRYVAREVYKQLPRA